MTNRKAIKYAVAYARERDWYNQNEEYAHAHASEIPKNCEERARERSGLRLVGMKGRSNSLLISVVGAYLGPLVGGPLWVMTHRGNMTNPNALGYSFLTGMLGLSAIGVVASLGCMARTFYNDSLVSELISERERRTLERGRVKV